MLYWLKKFRKKRLKITTLNSQWNDSDELILHASFQILTDFIEKEKPDKYTDWDADEHHKHARKEMQDLYDWWKTRDVSRDKANEDLFEGIDRPSLDEMFHPIVDSKLLEYELPDKYRDYGKALKEYGEMMEREKQEDEDNLIRLIKIRGYLWT